MASSAALALALLVPGAAQAHPHRVTPHSLQAERRREAAQLNRFEAALNADASATRVLEHWCARLNAADHATVTATLMPGAAAPLPANGKALLQPEASEPLGYRHVRLSCPIAGQPTVLSEAHNWYRPRLLTAEMNAALTDSDRPFGKVVAPLKFSREPLAALRGRGPGCPDGTVLTHRARLRLPDGRPLALLVECYLVSVLMPPPFLPPPPPPVLQEVWINQPVAPASH